MRNNSVILKVLLGFTIINWIGLTLVSNWLKIPWLYNIFVLPMAAVTIYVVKWNVQNWTRKTQRS